MSDDSPKTWFEWLRHIRTQQGKSLRVVSEEFIDPPLSEELLRLVELGHRRFSDEEFTRWCEVLAVSAQDQYPYFPLASGMELDRRAAWRGIKNDTSAEDTWNKWVRSVRRSAGYTLKHTADLIGVTNFFATTLSDVERGSRKFRPIEFEKWKEIFKVDDPLYDIPLADATSERARIAARQNRKNSRGAQPSHDELISRALKIINNPHLTQAQVEALVTKLREEASILLGL